MANTVETFQALFPEFCDVDPVVIQAWLDEGGAYLSQQAWGDCYDRAVRLWAAHNLAQSQARAAGAQNVNGKTVISGGTGNVTSASAGGLSVSYTAPKMATEGNAGEVDYAQTPYGIKYMALRDTCIGAGIQAGTIEDTRYNP